MSRIPANLANTTMLVRTRVALLTDDRLLCDGLVPYLNGEGDIQVTSAGLGDISDVAASCDIVLLDACGSADAPAASAIPQGASIIFVGAPEDDDWAEAALSAGSAGILTRSATREDVVKAIRVVRAGGIWARRRWLNACVQQVVDASRRVAGQALGEGRLSRREREVLREAATGLANKELADRLCISEATVKVHLTRIFQKLGVHGRAELAATYGEGAQQPLHVLPVVRLPDTKNHPFR